MLLAATPRLQGIVRSPRSVQVRASGTRVCLVWFEVSSCSSRPWEHVRIILAVLANGDRLRTFRSFMTCCERLSPLQGFKGVEARVPWCKLGI